jgi:hypothetical protein
MTPITLLKPPLARVMGERSDSEAGVPAQLKARFMRLPTDNQMEMLRK